MAEKLTAIQREKLKQIMLDPVKWANSFLSTYNSFKQCQEQWTARDYQQEMLRDKSRRKVYRCGRRTGKTETMVVDMLWRVCTRTNYRVVVVTPSEKQVQMIFKRLNELLADSPMVSRNVTANVKSPSYMISFNNKSAILGFTAGIDGASIRGQRADWIFLDEVDYMPLAAYEAVMAIAGERSSIGITMSSTPTGKRSHFYKACTDKSLGFNEHFHPSSHSPTWDAETESMFRAQLTEQGYIHEIEAEFGTQETGVFPKDKVDAATQVIDYAYNELTYNQLHLLRKENKKMPRMFNFNINNPAPPNMYRVIGVDWDKYQAGSSILVLEYNIDLGKFVVIKTHEVPRGEYSYDNAVNTIIEFNKIYDPSYIYVDAGAGEYQVERLHLYGEEHPESKLKNKVKKWNLCNKLDITDPITAEIESVQVKQFMVNQLTIAFEQDKLILSKYDEHLTTQLIDYEVVQRLEGGKVKYTSVNEHFVDALGLAYMAMVLEFKEITNMLKDMKTTAKAVFASSIGQVSINKTFHELQNVYLQSNNRRRRHDDDDLPGDKPPNFLPLNYNMPSRRLRSYGRLATDFQRTCW